MSNHENVSDDKIDDKDTIRGFIATASMGLTAKEEISEKYQFVESKIKDLKSLAGNSVPVQVRLAAPSKECRFYGILFLFSD